MTTKQLISLTSFASLAIIIGAYYFEYIGGFLPCKMCYWQRYPHFLNILILPIFYLFQMRSLILIGMMSMLILTVLAFYHVVVE